MTLKLNKDVCVTILLSVIIGVLAFLNSSKYVVYIEEPSNVLFNKSTNTLNISSLTLKQKIAQMIITYGKEENKEILKKMFIGGIEIGAKPSKQDFITTINNFQDGVTIPFFVTVDLEGCINPFENFQKFPSLKDIKTKEEAYALGYEQGKLLKELGFTVNFAPVVDLNDNIWRCRSFLGSPQEIAEKAVNYIKGLQENGIIATAKHYPGKTLSNEDPHLHITYAQIDEQDLLPFEYSILNNVSAIMVSHLIVNGSVDSESKPSCVSEKLIKELRSKFNGLIITDEINMFGLKKYYGNDIEKMYIDLFKADNDLILNFKTDPKSLYHMIEIVENAVKKGEISEERIDNSVIRILRAKGINVVR